MESSVTKSHLLAIAEDLLTQSRWETDEVDTAPKVSDRLHPFLLAA
ncbi:MAG TPA: hypothetical protein V6C84_29850 [Coleofasciculaceae cyanobacterium]